MPMARYDDFSTAKKYAVTKPPPPPPPKRSVLAERSKLDELVDAVDELRTMVKILLDAHLVREANEGSG